MLLLLVKLSVSPVKKLPPVMLTVALARLRLSGSLAVAPEMTETVEGEVCSSVQVELAEVIARVGGSLTLVMVTVVVESELVSWPPRVVPLGSIACQVRVRVGFEPKSVGFSPARN